MNEFYKVFSKFKGFLGIGKNAKKDFEDCKTSCIRKCKTVLDERGGGGGG